MSALDFFVSNLTFWIENDLHSDQFKNLDSQTCEPPKPTPEMNSKIWDIKLEVHPTCYWHSPNPINIEKADSRCNFTSKFKLSHRLDVVWTEFEFNQTLDDMIQRESTSL